ncbi:MAG: LacI family DNA-binding transcriptional regulator [Clostridia bacterium]|nr:LacI family DNA-binding transcriptional regulator [Clostridia bacterium]
MARERGSATMADVAREAGVALGTVSRVVNGESVGDIYRGKVEAAIRKLGYQYNSSGRVLRTDRTDTVALMIPNTLNPFFGLLVHHINLALEKQNYKMMLCFTGNDRTREEEYIQMAQSNRVDGIIALTYNPDLVIPEDIPFVTIDRFFSASVPCVAADNFGGGVMAARKLKELGCTRIAFLGEANALTNEPSKRKDGFVSACVEMGMPFEILALEEPQSFSEYEHFLVSHVKNDKLAFDGLFIGTDSLAWQVIGLLRKMNIRVPEDVQVIGFDGIRIFGDQEYIVSTIVQPVREIAETCVDIVRSNPLSNRPSLVCLPVSYAYGGSTLDQPGKA